MTLYSQNDSSHKIKEIAYSLNPTEQRLVVFGDRTGSLSLLTAEATGPVWGKLV